MGWFLDVIVEHLCAWRVLPKNSPRCQFSMPGTMQSGTGLRFAGNSPEFHGAIKGLGATKPPAIPPYNPAMQTPQEHTALVIEIMDAHHKELENRFLHCRFQ